MEVQYNATKTLQMDLLDEARSLLCEDTKHVAPHNTSLPGPTDFPLRAASRSFAARSPIPAPQLLPLDATPKNHRRVFVDTPSTECAVDAEALHAEQNVHRMIKILLHSASKSTDALELDTVARRLRESEVHRLEEALSLLEDHQRLIKKRCSLLYSMINEVNDRQEAFVGKLGVWWNRHVTSPGESPNSATGDERHKGVLPKKQSDSISANQRGAARRPQHAPRPKATSTSDSITELLPKRPEQRPRSFVL